MTSLDSFLKKCVFKTGKQHTHTWFDGVVQKMCITDVATFRRLFVSNLRPVSLTEKIGDTFPLFFDLDFDVETYSQQIRDYCIVAMEESITEILLDAESEKIVATRNDYKLHIYFPHVFVTKDTAKLIRDLIVNKVKTHFPDFKHTDKVIDKSVYSSGLRILGSHKGVMTKASDLENHARVFQTDYKETYTVQDLPLSIDLLELTSIHRQGDLTELNPNYAVPNNNNNNNNSTSSVTFKDLTPDEIIQVTEHLNVVLPATVQRNYRSFKKYTNTGTIKVDLEPQECPLAERTHSRCQQGTPSNYVNVTPMESSLRCYKCPDKLLLSEIPLLVDEENKLLLSSLYSQTHETISEHLFHKVKDSYASSLIRGGTYKHYYFDYSLHRWIQYEKLTLEIMANEGAIQREYSSYVQALITSDTLEKNTQDLLTKNLKSIQRNLQTTGFVSGGIVPLLSRKLDYYWRGSKGESFEARLDQDPQLIGFLNGVYDVGQVSFREGTPLDFVSMSTHINYRRPSLENSGHLDTFLSQLFTDPTHKAYFLHELASCLLGTQNQQRLFLLLGRGSNGKSTIAKLIDYTLGDYSGEFSSSLLTTPRPPANSPTPELLCLKGKRFIVGSEPNSTDALNLGTVKWLTGGDKIVGRNLHENTQSFYLQSTMFLLTNDVPQIRATASEWAVWRRLIPISFNSSFVKTPSKQGEFKTDLFLTDKLKVWNEAFMYLLLEKLSEDPVETPGEFVDLARQLQQKDDHYARFVNDFVVKGTETDDQYTECQHVFLQFVDWIKMMQFSKKVNYDSFFRNMSFHLGDSVIFKTRKCWKIFVKDIVT